MNLIEAMKSDKLFRLPGDSSWKRHNKELNILQFVGGDLDGQEYVIRPSEMMTNEWEVKEDRISITKQEFIRIWEESYQRHFPKIPIGSDLHRCIVATEIILLSKLDDFIEKDSSLDE